MPKRTANNPGRELTNSLIRWFHASRRELPWRTPIGKSRDPYHVLVSETMLQQTQVSRVVEKYERFVAAFPSVESLADARIDDVMGLWSGLGYYRRARNLHAAARVIADQFGGHVPESVEELMCLPGVGRYTAGAIVTIAFGRPAAAVDGNIQRVIMRIEGEERSPDSRDVQMRVWDRAGVLVRAASDPGAWTEGLMELGATVCIPKTPRCDACPIADRCVARTRGMQGRIPVAKTRRAPRDVYHAVALVRDDRGRLLLEQRAAGGMWAGLWQPPTIESNEGWASAAEMKRSIGLATARTVEEFVFQTTHRTVHVRVYAGSGARIKRGEFFDQKRIDSIGVSSLASRIIRG